MPCKFCSKTLICSNRKCRAENGYVQPKMSKRMEHIRLLKDQLEKERRARIFYEKNWLDIAKESLESNRAKNKAINATKIWKKTAKLYYKRFLSSSITDK